MTGSVPDPRIERSRRVILEATLDELADGGYGALTVEGVARRANVGKATIYRHWDGKTDLVADAVATLKQMVQPPDTDDQVRMVFAKHQAEAEKLLSTPRDERVIGED